TYGFLQGWWSDAGTFESLDRVHDLVAGNPPK
ncbi:MAG: spore coat protein, partial [Acidobacteria bacterium]|nr:spore coat protein [Acidobacteriota bacterium]